MVAACFEGHQRIACLREYQTSIRDSVKRLIEGKIAQFDQQAAFEVTEVEIRGPNESLFVFKGLHGENAASIKSLEGFTRAWVEEAQTISQRSIDILTPTFRSLPGGGNPEMWFVWNPDSLRDPVERMFAEAEPDDPDFVCVTATFRDNPWFPDDLRRDMERDRRRDPDKYAHVWLGGYQQRSERRVFHNWRVEEFETPDDARFYFGADWGYAVDPSVLVRCWKRGHDLFVDHEAYEVGCKIDNLPALFAKVPGSKKWRIRADSARPDTIDHLRDRGFNVVPSIKGAGSVEDGIEFLKSFDIRVHPRCAHTIDELATYSWKLDRRTDEVLPELEDRQNHVIDSLRYALEDERHAGRPLILSKKAIAAIRSRPRDRFAPTSRDRFARAR